MYNPTRSHQGSALIVGLIIVVLLTILTTSFLEKILNLGKTSGGIGNSAQSYSLATGLIEEQLMDGSMSKQEPWNIATVNNSYTSTGRILTAATGGDMMPVIGKGNSSFDPDWNIIGLGEPVQIVIPSGITWGSVNFYFRVPAIPGTSTGVSPSISSSGIILWTFGYSGASLYASGETNIFIGSTIDGGIHSIAGYNGLTNTGVSKTFQQFYDDYGANCGSLQCTLKLSMIRQLINNASTPQSYPFLEYRITFDSSVIPSQYMIIDSSAYVHGYLRSRQVRIPQITTNTATDFAVLQ